jgi:hypothetical protein
MTEQVTADTREQLSAATVNKPARSSVNITLADIAE